MKGTVLYGPGDIRFESLETPRIEKATDAVIRIAATCVCGSDTSTCTEDPRRSGDICRT